MGERTCPFNNGSHKFLVTSWGRSCRFCHRTWQWRGRDLVPTWPDSGGRDDPPADGG